MVETMVRVMRGNGRTDAQNADLAQRIVAERERVEQAECERVAGLERPFRVAA